MKWMKLVFAVALTTAVVFAAPPAGAVFNECKLTGATTSTGQQVAPPCIDTRPESDELNPAYTAACGGLGDGCPRFYVFLYPDFDGQLSNGLQLDSRMVWQETNGCDGLQRFRLGGCAADTPLVL